MHDSTMVETAEDTLRDVLKEGGDGLLDDCGETQCGSSQDDFFEMLSRMQSKRLDEQRCDPSILSDVTNRKGPRQTDVLVISPSGEPAYGSSSKLND
uniref:Uncharacterized protein n=1 Tax=Heterorhabditis bacteriophora TaxID=37862 RepID=A0A1I7XKU2_HETBA